MQSYGLIGMLETTASFAMSYWYLQRRGYAFHRIWFSFGNLPADWDTDDAVSGTVRASPLVANVRRL